MDLYIIPKAFMNELAAKPNEWKILWLKWIAEGNFLAPDFLATHQYKNIDHAEVVKCYSWGYGHLRDGIEPNQLEHKVKLTVYDSVKAKRKKVVQTANKMAKQIGPIEQEFCRQVLTMLNTIAGTSFNIDAVNYHKLILMRYNEGYKITDFEKVIRSKHAKWANTDFQEYIRPLTLFGERFDTYLNETNNGKTFKKSSVEDAMRNLSSNENVQQ